MEIVIDKLTEEGKRFMEAIRELGELQVRVGFQRGREISQENGVDLCDIASWNELGTSTNIPSRPFLRDSVDKHAEEINAFLESQAKFLVRGTSAQQILKNIGLYQKAKVQEEITDGEFEANRKATIQKKKSDHPLIDTGHMRNSVNYIVCRKGEYD